MDRSAQRYQMALAQQVYGVILVSEDGRVEFVNQQFCDMVGLERAPGDLVGLPSPEFLRLVAPSYADPARALLRVREALSANVERLGEEVLMRDGRTMLVDYTPIVVDGEPNGRMWTHRDITSIKRAEDALRWSEEKFSTAFRISPYAMSISRLEDGVFLEVNDAFVSISGYSRDELIGISVLSVGLWADEADRDRLVAALQLGQAVTRWEHGFRKKNGEMITGLLSAQVVELSQGPCILSSVEDITDAKRVEQDLQRNRRFLSDVVEHGAAIIFVKGRDGRYELVNKRWEETTGFKREDVIGRTDEELFPGPAGRDFRLGDLKVMESEAELETELSLELGGRKRHLMSSKFPVYDEDGTVHGVCGMVTDITALKEVEEKIRHLATHDGLTDLPSLTLAKDRLTMAVGMARRQNTRVGVLFVDLDGFKAVNDTLGHEAGDSVLREVARRMLACVRETDTVARVGGDEFLIVAGGLHSEKDAGRIADKVVRAVAEPVVLDDGRQAAVGASIGIALCKVCGEDPDRLIRLADAAMYRVKNAGKNGYCFAEPADSS